MDGGLCMGDNYFLLTNLLSEDERKVITSITAHIERGEKRAGIQQIAAESCSLHGKHHQNVQASWLRRLQ